MFEANNCPLCDGPLMFLGQLGNRVHARCRNCGMDTSWEIARDIFDLELEVAS